MSLNRLIPFVVLLISAIFLGGSLLPHEQASGFDLDSFGRLPVLTNGRVKPLDSVARNTLLFLQGRQSVKTPSGESLTPTRWLLDVFFRPEIADTYQHFEIVHPDLLAPFNLKPEDGAGTKRFSYNQLVDHLQEIDRQATLSESVESSTRNAYQRAALNLRNHVILYQQLKHSLVMPDGSDFLGTLTHLQEYVASAKEAIKARESKKPYDEKLATFALDAGASFLRMAQIGHLLPIPPLNGSDSGTGWQQTGQSLLQTFRTGSVNPYALTYARLAHAWKQQETDSFNTILRLYRSELDKSFPALLKKTDVETSFNTAAPFYKSMYFYVLAFLLAVASWLKWPNVLQKSAFYLVLFAWIATTGGILARMWLEHRPPVTNLYSSALFVGWAFVVLCLILERIFKNGVGSAVAGLAGFCTLLIAHHLSLTGDTMEMMRAVLDSNFWLATHVVVVTIGYAATFLAGFLAIIYVVLGIFTTWLNQTPTTEGTIMLTKDAAISPAMNAAAIVIGKKSDTNGQMISRMVYGIVCFATLFSLVGTILGGIWADQSWGRFWGWDPKENGALIIVIWNAIILHARWGGLIRQRGLMALAIFGNIVTSWSWFGVNMLGVGLHSYGFMDAAFWWLIAFVATQLVLIALAYLPAEKWRSALSIKQPCTAHDY